MIWEELKVYRPLKKEELKESYKRFTNIIAENLSHFGFKLVGRRLIKRSDDLFHVIHLDTRGNWTGLGDSFKTEIAITSIYDTEVFVKNYELTGSRSIESLIPNLKNYYRITEEYPLLADFITRKIIDYVLPYFDKYRSSRQILADRTNFKIDNITQATERNRNLIMLCELGNNQDVQATNIIRSKIDLIQKLNHGSDELKELIELIHILEAKDWEGIREVLNSYKAEVFKKLRIKENQTGNTV
ncbi:hypothetical protein [Pontibacter populi]|uniref:DUF4304 domain-containing protein n=1 Tax=Pontibacter populi TaxID=890055 RepID=A0ABV1RRX2_9BACT